MPEAIRCWHLFVPFSRLDLTDQPPGSLTPEACPKPWGLLGVPLPGWDAAPLVDNKV